MRRQRLTPDDLEDLARLEQRVLNQDGIRLKLEWPSLREGRTVAALTHRNGPDLVGFLGVYSFGGPPDVELTGMVDPAFRRQGIAGTLLDRAREICGQEGLTHRLAVVPRASSTGASLVRGRGGEIEHSEHSMILRTEPQRVAEDPRITIRRADDEVDLPDLIRILTAGFGPPPEGMLRRLHTDVSETVMIDFDGAAVGTLRSSLNEGLGGVFGFAIDPEWRGRGIGRDVLGRICSTLRDRGADRVELQVEVENDNALHLYTSTGFEPVSTEDYYKIP